MQTNIPPLPPSIQQNFVQDCIMNQALKVSFIVHKIINDNISAATYLLYECIMFKYFSSLENSDNCCL